MGGGGVGLLLPFPSAYKGGTRAVRCFKRSNVSTEHKGRQPNSKNSDLSFPRRDGKNMVATMHEPRRKPGDGHPSGLEYAVTDPECSYYSEVLVNVAFCWLAA